MHWRWKQTEREREREEREREESFGVPLEGEEEALMESERGSEESLEMNKDIAVAARRERKWELEVDESREWLCTTD